LNKIIEILILRFYISNKINVNIYEQEF
jgi:hypothetical protein